MLRKEWSLIVITLSVQLGAGIFIFFAILRALLAGSVDSSTLNQFTSLGMAMAAPIVAFGMGASFFHLGNPYRAYRAVTNIGSSWLSREVLFISIFLGLIVVNFLLEYFIGPSTIVTWVTAFTAILSVISMTTIYYATGKPGWYTVNTYIKFLSSIVIMGIPGAAIISMFGKTMYSSLHEVLFISYSILSIVVAFRFVHQMITHRGLKISDVSWTMDNLVFSSALKQDLMQMYKRLNTTGLIMSLCSAPLTLVILGTRTISNSVPFIIILAIVIITGETLCRTGFYALGHMDDKEVVHVPGRDVYGRYVR